MSESIRPLALLLGLDGSEELVTLQSLPPPSVFLKPRQLHWSVSAYREPPCRITRIDREFILTSNVAPEHHWWFVYNGGRSRTPKPAFVYRERRTQQ